MSTQAATKSTGGTLGATSALVAAENVGRAEITIVNDHAVQVIYLQLATNPDVEPTAVANQGIRLNAAGGSWTTNNFDGAIAGIASGAGTGYTIVEF